MIFERYDHVKLVKIDDDLMRKGLSEGCVGDVVKVDNNVSVAFYNLSNLGDFALFVVDASYLELISKVKDDEQNRLQDIIFEKALRKKEGFHLNPFKEFDEVELLKNKECYQKYGLGIGSRGFVVLDYATNGKVLVDFGEQMHRLSTEDDGMLSINIDDLKKV